MPAGKPSQSNAMLYTVIIFVALFIISTSCAVIFYIKSEEYKIQADDAAREMSAFASRSEQGKIGAMVGKPLKGKSVLGTMVMYIDDLVEAVTGAGPEETTAAVKVNEAKMKINEVLEPLKDRLTGATGPRGVDLVETVRQLTAELDALKGSLTMPTILPGASLFLGLTYAPAREMIEAGLPVALASDYNPGSSPSGNMELVMSLGIIQLKMLPYEVLNAVTRNGAYAMGLEETHGTVTPGKVANLIITDPMPRFGFMPYAYGSSQINKVILNGKIQ